MVSKGKIHAIANCRECSWNNEDYKNAQRKARLHNKETGHIVDVEVGVWHVIGEDA